MTTKQPTFYQVNEVARIAGISVRALRHYDEIGLLVPARRSDAGYRLYDEQSLLRLQQILLGRELGLSLEDIRRSLDDPQFDRRRALHAQRQQLRQRARQTEALIRAVDAALTLLETDLSGDDMNIEKIFDGFDPSRYETETQEKWGNTPAFREAAKRTTDYRKEDWAAIQFEQADIYDSMARTLQAGTPADDPLAMDIAERHRLSIDRWFYPCGHAMHVRLAEMYEADSRFAENIDRHGVGLTPYLATAIRANAERANASA